ncbi:MAG TPA: 2-succinyl-5-enolpyruvyl-6-hydroxy-3-cyclohexene-1-carboxylic-acid synthase [Arsenophonus apicola]|uniref:2-succinyl-5-enolpyruvyl-6-hydroxy-3- cyclohexene-1-carboxylic-acid synthase n=1 Tax=Arsenophonus TaxID=637 RepID=UPI0015D6EE69|nr:MULTISPECIES: 2-succinyl-5-enolpyruvyl-6-hydroxy-3-cyclohexene-1-carboxylic-acid synthase [Arsenophonus]UBX30056.1 2-succinyl-5-enolpyruvyl-6-hydroxy-3-cyclohexene-1-carboxylic-acid synthase [Arsenophonus apicola]
MSHSVFNRQWAQVILEALTRHGLSHVCIAPGSRSTPLTLAAAANSKLICHTHYDERGLGYFALGLAKVVSKPVAVIVTSGTAVANLYPALIEAGLTGENIIFLTADRPAELIDCGANQAIRQTAIFADHPAQTLTLPSPTQDISAQWLISTIDNAMNNLSHGAVHINCPFAEPLYGQASAQIDWQNSLASWWQSSTPWLSGGGCHSLALVTNWHVWRQKKGLVIAGRMRPDEGAQVAQWAEMLGWSIISDVLSQTGQPLPCADLWLSITAVKNILQNAQLVVQFGSSLTSKRLLEWQAQCQPEEYWIIDPIPGRLDPANHRGKRLVSSVSNWLIGHPAITCLPWANELIAIVNSVYSGVRKQLDQQFSEAAIAHQLAQLLPINGQLFVGNSLIVRLIDALCQLPANYPIYSNRGASGIDGLIATLAGVHAANAKPTLGIIGDISALYDLNSLNLLRACLAPTVLIVVNNNGGQIFSMLPTPEAERERFYCMPHQLQFKHAAAMFGLSYAAPSNWHELKDTINDYWQHGGKALMIELLVAGDEGAKTLNQLVNQMMQL